MLTKQQKTSGVKGAQRFTKEGALNRIENNFEKWCSALIIPGTDVPWLTRDGLKGHFWCRACASYGKKHGKVEESSLASKDGLAPSSWTRLGTFKTHAKSKMHQMSCIDFAQSINPTGEIQKTLAPTVKHLKELATDFRANKRLKNKFPFTKRHLMLHQAVSSWFLRLGTHCLRIFPMLQPCWCMSVP